MDLFKSSKKVGFPIFGFHPIVRPNCVVDLCAKSILRKLVSGSEPVEQDARFEQEARDSPELYPPTPERHSSRFKDNCFAEI